MPIYQNYINKEQLTDLKFVLSLIRAEINKDQADRIRLFVKTNAIDWQFVLHFVERHRLLPVFYANIKKMELQSFLPGFIRNNLSHQYLNIIGYNLNLVESLTGILALFKNRNIPVVPFKGPLLAHHLYDDSELRFCQDLDLLVPKTYVTECRKVLEEAGFFPREKDLSGHQHNQLLKYGRECDFTDASRYVNIDLHWQLGGPFRHSYDYEFCEKRLQLIWFKNREVFSLSEEDTLLHLCVNGTHDIWNNLEKILCVAEYIDRHPGLDWELVQKLADQIHCRRILLLGLFLSRDVFDVAIPLEIIDKMEKDKKIDKIARKIYFKMFQGGISQSHIEKRLAEIPYHLGVREQALDKFLYLFRRIFIPTQKDRKYRPLYCRRSCLYFFKRPIDLMVELAEAKLKKENP